MKRLLIIALALVVAVTAYVFVAPKTATTQLAILAGSENAALEPLVMDWAAANNVDVTVTYQGSVDISRALGAGKDAPFDAVWPAHSLWIALGDTQKTVAHATSILRSPVVLALRQSIADDLGWKGRDDITIQMIEEAARNKSFRLSMTSATQSNSGASAYLGFLYALSGNPDMLTMANLAVAGRPIIGVIRLAEG
jgi:Ca-activated chloride channel homolog